MSLSVVPTPGSNAERSRAYNRSLVLGHVRGAGASGRAEIARASGLSTQAVSNIIGELVAEGWLFEAGKRSEGRGLPAVQYALAPAAGTAIGVEVRPDALLVALTDLDGSSLATERHSLTRADPDTVAALIAQARDRALAQSGVDPARLLGAGVVMPGPFGATGLTGAASDLPGWAQMDARALFAEALDLPVIIENDANAAAMAERISGVAQGLHTYAYLYFGTGLGLGVVTRGELMRGAHGNAGEIGHIPVAHATGPVPLEQIVSRFALRARTGADSVDALQALHANADPNLMGWLDDAAPALANAVQIVENLFDPETVIIGGAMPEALLDALVARVVLAPASVANRPDRVQPRLMRGTCGRMTATFGAAALVINQAFTPRMASPA